MNIFNYEPKYSNKGSTEKKILNAAKVEFTKYGLKGAKMQSIADRAGVNKALLHYYFRSKKNMFEMVFQITANRFFAKLRKEIQKLPENPSFRELLELFVRSHINTIRANPFFPRLIAGNLSKFGQVLENLPDKIAKSNSDVINKFKGTLRKEIVKGNIKPVDPIHIIINVIGMSVMSFIAQPLIGTIYKKYLKKKFRFNDDYYEKRINSIVELVYNGLKTEGN